MAPVARQARGQFRQLGEEDMVVVKKYRTHRRVGRFLRWMAHTAPLLILLTQLVGPATAYAWKPYTHTYTGLKVWSEITTNGSVTITTPNGSHQYPVDSRIVTALRKWPSDFNAGVIGPDGFPDITFGQAVVHPAHTGQWLRYLYKQAWMAQNDSRYSDDEKGQILAFSYGFMVHAAGDMWGHTLVNSFGKGVFPSVEQSIADLLHGDQSRFDIALRHIIAEGYAGNATPGWDTTEGDDVPDPTLRCASLSLDPPDTLCTKTDGEVVRLEPSQVCTAAQMASPPPGTTCQVPGFLGQLVPDVSQSSTLGIPFDVPADFIENVLVDTSAPTPFNGCADGRDYNGDGIPNEGCPGGVFKLSTDAKPLQPSDLSDRNFLPSSAIDTTRGPAIDFFIDLEAQLQIKRAIEEDKLVNNCLVDVPFTDCQHVDLTLTVPTIRGVASVPTGHFACTQVCVGDPSISVPALLTRDYINAWLHDIDAGLAHWSDFSLALTRGLFDPQTRRDAENDVCRAHGIESVFNIDRLNCEKAVNLKDAAFFAANNFYSTGESSWFNRYLIPMLGFPDFLGDLRQLGQDLRNVIDDVFSFLGLVNPLDQILADVHEFIVGKVEDYVKQTFGIDIPSLETFLTHPGEWMCGLGSASVTLFGVTITAQSLFTAADHARLDGYMKLPPGHHEDDQGLPTDCGPLEDSAKFDEQRFAAVVDSTTQARLLFLDGNQLDRALGDALVDAGVIRAPNAVVTYGRSTNFDSNTNGGTFPANVMIDTLDAGGSATANPGPWDLWLQLIDGDHAWRRDGLPRFGSPDSSGACALPPEMTKYLYSVPCIPRRANQSDFEMLGGNGHYPLWSSCLLRPAFRSIFGDWENGDNLPQTNFPELGDPPVADASITSAASSALSFSGTSYTNPATGTVYIAGDNIFILSATDPVFQTSQLALQYRFFPAGVTPPGYQPGARFSIPASAGDGAWDVNSRAKSPCVDFASAPATSNVYVLDTTAPQIAIAQPAAATYTHSDVLTLSYSVDDGSGSGVKSFTATLDGATTLNGHGLASGQPIQLLTELPLGQHTFTISAVDNVGNSDSTTVTFTVIVTPDSIKGDVNEFLANGAIRSQAIATSLLAKLASAANSRAAGDCSTASNIYTAFINDVNAQAGKAISVTAAAVMVADAQYLIEHCQ